jgi:hypothetical protein
MKTQDALSLLAALEERVGRIYFRFFRAFREEPVVARCWWEMAREEHGHAGILKMVRELVAPSVECGEIGPRLWALVETVERCERQALEVDSLTRALELAIRLESSELDALGHRLLQSMGAELPEGAARPFIATEAHCRRLVEAAEKVPDRLVRRRLEAMLGGTHRA